MARDDDRPQRGVADREPTGAIIRSLPAIEKPPIPFGLPAGPAIFVDREDEDRMALAAVMAAGRSAVVLAVSGLAGTGTSSFAHTWAHRHGPDRYPDGILYADLAEERWNGATAVSAVLARFLTTLRCEVPADFGARVERYRTVLNGKRVLVVLDHVENEAEVRALCPPSAGSAVLLTSHRQARYATGQQDIPMKRLGDAAARELVTELLVRAGADPSQPGVAELVDACDHMPAVLHQAVDRMRHNPNVTVEDLNAWLVSERRRTDSAGGSVSVMDIVAGDAVASLSAEAARVHRLLGWHPGPDIAKEAVHHLAGSGAVAGLDIVDELYSRHLLEAGSPGRYRLPPLIRDHIRRRAPHAEDEALEVWTQWYLGYARIADRTAIPDRHRVFDAVPAAGSVSFADDAAAMDWLDRERLNLLALQRRLADHDRHPEVIGLAEAMWVLYIGARYLEDWVTSMRLGLDAALAEGDPSTVSRFRSLYARALMDNAAGAADPEHWYARAAEELELARAVSADSRFGADMRASATEFTGRLCGYQRRYPEAIRWYRLALDLFGERAEDVTAPESERRIARRAIALQHQFLGRCQMDAGDHSAAVDSLRRAEAGLLAHSHYRDVAKVRTLLGEALRLIGDPAGAHAVLDRAVRAVEHTTTWVRVESDALWQLSFVARDLGDVDLETACLERLRDRYSITRSPRLDRVTARLVALSG